MIINIKVSWRHSDYHSQHSCFTFKFSLAWLFLQHYPNIDMIPKNENDRLRSPEMFCSKHVSLQVKKYCTVNCSTTESPPFFGWDTGNEAIQAPNIPNVVSCGIVRPKALIITWHITMAKKKPNNKWSTISFAIQKWHCLVHPWLTMLSLLQMIFFEHRS